MADQQALLQQWFAAVDRDQSGQIDVSELQQALSQGNNHFEISTVRLMMKMFDRSGEGTINFQEFTGLWRYLQDWQTAFNQFDADHSGRLDAREMVQALKTQGFNFSQDVYDAVARAFAQQGGTYGLAQFIEINVLLGWIRNSFVKLDKDQSAVIHVDYATFVKLVLQFRY